MMKWVIIGLSGVFMNLFSWFVRTIELNNRGEDAGGDKGGGDSGKTFTQEQVNSMLADNKRGLQTELVGTQEQVKILQEQLSKFQQDEESRKQAKLEEEKNYEKLKEGWATKENDYKNVISQRESEIKNMRITNALTNEIMRQNAYPDAIDLIKQIAEVDDKGNIKIKGKNSSGVDDLLPIEEGVKSFLKQRPYLVKATGSGGSGTPPAAGGTGDGSGSGSGDDPMALSKELEAAIRSGDRKKVVELKAKIGSKLANLQK